MQGVLPCPEMVPLVPFAILRGLAAPEPSTPLLSPLGTPLEGASVVKYIGCTYPAEYSLYALLW